MVTRHRLAEGRFYSQTALASRRQTNTQAFDDALVEESWRSARSLRGITQN